LESLNLFHKAIEIEPTNAGYYHVLAGALEKLERNEEANKNYLFALELDNQNVQLVNDYLDFLLKLNNWKGFELFIHEFETSNKDVIFMIQLINGVKEYRIGNTETAVYIFNVLISQNVEKSKEIFSMYPELLNDNKIVNLFPISKD